MTSSATRSPRVSVVLPVYDTPVHFVAEAIESVFAQRETAWELVIVLDGATPDCAQLARAALERDTARVRVVGWEGGTPGGLSAARNRGISQSTAPLVAFLDADDVFLPPKLAEQVDFLERNPTAAMAYGRTVYWHSWREEPERSRDAVLPLGVPIDHPIPPPDLLTAFVGRRASVPSPCSVMVRRSALEAIRGFNEDFRGDLQLIEDQAFYAKICLRFPVVVADVLWDRYRRHPDAMTSQASDAQLGAAWRGYLDWLEGEIRAAGVADAALAEAMQRERWKLDHPALAKAFRLSRKALRRLGAAMGPGGETPRR